MACQHFARVVGVKQSFVPESDVPGIAGERIAFPPVPSGARVLFLARNPANPTEELWMLCVEEPGDDLGAFFTNPAVQQLTYQEMLALGTQFDPNFIAPPIQL